MEWRVLVTLACLLQACWATNEPLCPAIRSWCRIPALDLRTTPFAVIGQHQPDKFLSVSIGRLQIGSMPLAAVMVNASRLTAALTFQKFHEPQLQLVGALMLDELVLQEATLLQTFTAQTNLQLRRLEINQCALTIIPPSVRNLPRLKDLTVRGCLIKTLNLALLATLGQLETVMLTANQIARIHPPSQVSINQSVTLLDLSYNRFTLLNLPALATLRRIRFLGLTYNQLTRVSFGLADTEPVAFPALNVLDLSYNKLRGLDLGLLSAPRLDHLRIMGNELVTAPESLGKFPRLKTLTLIENALQSFSFTALRGLLNLTHLELANNRLQTLDTGGSIVLPQLWLLNLADNRLEGLDLSGLSVPRLGQIMLDNNQLTLVPRLFDDDNMKVFSVSVIGNPLTCATLEAHRSHIEKKALVPRWLIFDTDPCPSGKFFVLNEKRRSCCTS